MLEKNLSSAQLSDLGDPKALLLASHSHSFLLDPPLLANSTALQKFSKNFFNALLPSCLADFVLISGDSFTSSSGLSSAHSFSASSKNCCIDNSVLVPITLRTDVSNFQEASLDVTSVRGFMSTTRKPFTVQGHPGSDFAVQRLNESVCVQITSDATHHLFPRGVLTQSLISATFQVEDICAKTMTWHGCPASQALLRE